VLRLVDQLTDRHRIAHPEPLLLVHLVHLCYRARVTIGLLGLVGLRLRFGFGFGFARVRVRVRGFGFGFGFGFAGSGSG
jgi:hypothetical protein